MNTDYGNHDIYSHDKKAGIFYRYSSFSKFLIVLTFLICTSSFPHYNLIGTSAFLFFSFILISASGISILPILLRSLLVLPFVFCTGVVNCFLDIQPVTVYGDLILHGGFLSLLVLICKALASINIVLLFSGCTPFQEIAGAMITLHIPCIFVLQIQLMFRYLFVLLEEAHLMRTAWHLRNPSVRYIPISEWGTLTGHLLVRSFDRANSVYQAMQCRLFHAGIPLSRIRPTSFTEHIICAVFIIFFILVRISL